MYLLLHFGEKMPRIFYSIICAFIIVIGQTGSIAFASDSASAKHYVTNVSNEVIQILKEPLEQTQKIQKLEGLFGNNVDTNWIARFVLGRTARTLSESDLASFRDVYRRFLLTTYLPLFLNYNNQTVAILRSQELTADEFEVQTTLLDQKTSISINMTYRVRYLAKEKRFMIIDLVTEGVSLITTQRAEFNSVITEIGFDGLVSKLKAKLQPNQT
jgi:phospholipid transport system substrate-binding protein